MKKPLTLSITALTLSASIAMAATQNNVPTIALYATPSIGKIVETVPVTTYLTPIFRQQNWLKVGDASNGQVGWINVNNYYKVRDAYYTPTIQTIYVTRSDIDKNGKSTVTVVAYKNGQKVSDTEAKALYAHMLEQQAKEQAWQQQYWNNMNRMLQMQQQEMDQMFDNAMPVAMMPGPVILVPTQKK